jgi:hypothetical protein
MFTRDLPPRIGRTRWGGVSQASQRSCPSGKSVSFSTQTQHQMVLLAGPSQAGCPIKAPWMQDSSGMFSSMPQLGAIRLYGYLFHKKLYLVPSGPDWSQAKQDPRAALPASGSNVALGMKWRQCFIPCLWRLRSPACQAAGYALALGECRWSLGQRGSTAGCSVAPRLGRRFQRTLGWEKKIYQQRPGHRELS